jgi:hypothetical protein
MPTCTACTAPPCRYSEFIVEGAAAIHLTGYFMPEYEMGAWVGASLWLWLGLWQCSASRQLCLHD